MIRKYRFQYLCGSVIFLLLAACTSPNEPANDISAPVTKNSISVNIPKNNHFSLYRSSDYGLTWQAFGEGLPNGTQVSFMEMLGNEMVLATDNEGVLISENNLTAWKSVGLELPNKKINGLHIANGNIYVTVYKKGIYYSPNRGQNWISLNYDLPELRLQTILRLSDKLLVGGDSGIYALKDGEKKWHAIYQGPQILSFNHLENKIIAGTGQGVLLSTDTGGNWRWVHQEGAIHYTALLEDKIFAMHVYNEVAVSDDWGANWQEANYGPKEASYVYEVVKIGGYFIMSNNYGVHRSNDGLNWELIYPNEKMIFFDFLVLENMVYGGMRGWDEFRGRG